MKEMVKGDYSAYFVKTDKGVWIRSDVNKMTGFITLAWQHRIKFQESNVRLLDYAGRTVFEGHYSPLIQEMSESWSSTPIISMDDEFFYDLDTKTLKEVRRGIMVHAARLLALGEAAPSEIAEWMSDPRSLDFLLFDHRYELVQSLAPFEYVTSAVATIIDMGDPFKIEAAIGTEVVQIDLDGRVDLLFLRAFTPSIPID